MYHKFDKIRGFKQFVIARLLALEQIILYPKQSRCGKIYIATRENSNYELINLESPD